MNISRYRVMRKLGTGGMGDIYLAHDPKLNRYVALKLCPRQFVDDPQRLARFHQEAQLASSINHPNVLTIYDIDRDRDIYFLVTEYVDGVNLRERMGDGPLSVGGAIEIAIGVARALEAAHEYWVLHRDIKPENIMVRNDGWIKVLDFGLAKLLEDSAFEGEISPVATAPGTVPGTLAYAAPERLVGDSADPRSDIFSLGCVLYEMLAGVAPFAARSLSAIVEQIVGSEPLVLDRVRRDVSEPLARLVWKMLRKNPAERPQTAKAVLDELASLPHEVPVAS